MNRTTRSSVAARTRALARLRSITIGTTFAGLAGVAGFGTIAAISNSGVPPTTVAAADDGTTDSGTGTAGQTTTTTTSKSTTTNSQLNAAATPTPTRTTTSRHAHVTTGSSG